ncbi:LiaF domain-containing protein [Sediminispirochaeta smaragdinae]|uniref:LiaF domain-containing protein n=1 Tax=Sediminispirochaeta smaragdinae TaxID=55206 RepID=UPI001FDFD99F|nr:LiaF domain-containing protein [Sediminispirochaeta smaragdinae]
MLFLTAAANQRMLMVVMDEDISYEHPPMLPLPKFRERVVEQLKLNFAHNNIEVDEFERRVSLAHESDDRQVLGNLIRDLPVLRDEENQEYSSSVAWNNGRVKRDDTMLALLSGVERRGPWSPARNTRVLALMGGVDLDFTDAKFPPGTTEIEIVCLLGGVEMVVPEGVNVDISGIPLIGGFENKMEYDYYPDGPTLKIRGFALLGGVEVRPPRKRKKSDRHRKRRRGHGRIE